MTEYLRKLLLLVALRKFRAERPFLEEIARVIVFAASKSVVVSSFIFVAEA